MAAASLTKKTSKSQLLWALEDKNIKKYHFTGQIVSIFITLKFQFSYGYAKIFLFVSKNWSLMMKNLEWEINNFCLKVFVYYSQIKPLTTAYKNQYSSCLNTSPTSTLDTLLVLIKCILKFKVFINTKWYFFNFYSTPSNILVMREIHFYSAWKYWCFGNLLWKVGWRWLSVIPI